LTSTSVWYGRVCVTAEGASAFAIWSGLGFALLGTSWIEVGKVSRKAICLSAGRLPGSRLSWRRRAEAQPALRPTWPKKELLWLIRAVREHAPQGHIAESAERYWTR